MKQQWILPQVTFTFTQGLPDTELLLIAGGRPPAGEWLKQVCAGREVWCVDKGIDSCWRQEIRPQRMIGDGDSALKDSWQWGASLGIPVEKHPVEKDLTDLQLALQRAGEVHENLQVLLTGVWGGRFDHAFANLYSLLGSKQWGVKQGCAADEQEVLLLLEGPNQVSFQTKELPAAISLLPMSSSCTGVSIGGTHWPLQEVILEQALPYAISNCTDSVAQKVQVKVNTGWLGVYLCWDEKSIC